MRCVTFVEERKKGGGPLNTPIILIIMLIVLTCVWTFQLWKKKMENRRRDVRESEELEESVRMENEIKFRKQSRNVRALEIVRTTGRGRKLFAWKLNGKRRGWRMKTTI